MGEKNLIAIDTTSLTLSHYTAGSTKTINRRACIAALAGYTFTVNLSHINPSLVTTDSKNPTATHGIAWALCNVPNDMPADDSDTWPIKTGDQVCLDLTTLQMVTGLNPHWAKGEYIVMGEALEDFPGPGVGRIPIKLHKGAEVAGWAEDVWGNLAEDIHTSSTTSPTMVVVGKARNGEVPDSPVDAYQPVDSYFTGKNGARCKLRWSREDGWYIFDWVDECFGM